MKIRRAEEKDIPRIDCLLRQVLDVHQKGRPDIFKAGSKKYTDSQLAEIICDDTRPIFVAADDADAVQGYIFCVIQENQNQNNLSEIKTLYIDDLCVDEGCQGKHIGKALYETALAFAKLQGCYHVTLNVWSCNKGAMKFYEKLGLKPQKITMEKIL